MSGHGKIFKLTSGPSGWTDTVLHSFSGGSDGAYPSGPLILINGALYGVATEGGSGGTGTVYKIATDGSGFTVLHSFGSGMNHYPEGPLATDGSGALYGTTVFGGGGSCDSSLGCGAVYKLMTDGSGFTTIHAFIGVNGGDGAAPEAGGTLFDGDFYGTTAVGGNTGCAVQGGNAAGCGTIFKLIPSGSGYSESVLHDFSATASGQAQIPSGLLASGGGTFYGTTSAGGSCLNAKFPDGCGTVFSMTTGGSFEILHGFLGPPNDGAYPFGGTPARLLSSPPLPPFATAASSGGGAGLAVDGSGALWGATFDGGSGSCFEAYGCGAVYQLLIGDTVRRRR